MAYEKCRFVSHSSGGWKPKVRVSAWLVGCWRGLSPGLQTAAFLLCPPHGHMWGESSLGSLIIKGHQSHSRGLSLQDLTIFPKSSLLHTIGLRGLGFQPMVSGDANPQAITPEPECRAACGYNAAATSVDPGQGSHSGCGLPGGDSTYGLRNIWTLCHLALGGDWRTQVRHRRPCSCEGQNI